MAGQPKTRAAKKAAEDAKKKRLALSGSARKPRLDKPVAPAVKKAREQGLTVFGHLESAWTVFLDEYERTCRQDLAATKSNIPKSSVYARRDNDHAWAAKFEKSRKVAISKLEDEGMRRAIEGVTRNVHYQGTVIDTITDYSDSLLQFMLQANDERYKKQQELNLKGSVNHGSMTDPEIDALLKAKEEELRKLEDGG